MCLQGQFARAAKVLASDGLAPNNKGTFKALKNINPKEPLLGVCIHDDIASNAFQFSENIVYEQLKTFSKHIAAGPSKTFPEHLQHAVDCTAPDQPDVALRAIKFVNFDSRGLFPTFISKALCCASLLALSKKKGGVRLIPAGEVLRRLIAKCLASKLHQKPLRCLIVCNWESALAEAIIHLSKITHANIVSAQSDDGVLQIDFQNALNSVKHSHLLKATCEFIPGIVAFSSFCYSQHTPLFYNKSIIQSEKSGVQQGDPLGPLLFSVTLWPIIKKIRTSVPSLLQHTWFLDDGFIAGSEDQIKQTLGILDNEGPERGLILTKDKFEQWSIKDCLKGVWETVLKFWAQLLIKKRICRFLFEEKSSNNFFYLCWTIYITSTILNVHKVSFNTVWEHRN